MKLEGDFSFGAARSKVWNAVLDPKVIAKIMPGCEELEETGENQYKGVMKVRVGPVQGKFQGTVGLSEIQEPESYRIEVGGKGPSGFLKGSGVIRLSPGEDAESTQLSYSIDAQVGGRIAGVGQRLIETTAKSIARQSLQTLERLIDAQAEAESQGKDAPDFQAPSPARMAAGVAKDIVRDVAGRFRVRRTEEPDVAPKLKEGKPKAE